MTSCLSSLFVIGTDRRYKISELHISQSPLFVQVYLHLVVSVLTMRFRVVGHIFQKLVHRFDLLVCQQ